MKKILLFIVIASLMVGCKFGEREYSNDIYLVPEGFDGAIFIFYDVPNKPKFKNEGKFSVIPVELQVSETLAGSGLAVYGVAFTSEPLQDAWHNDKYFYVDESGKRKRLKEDCAFIDGSGGLSGDNEGGIGVSYNVIYVTNSSCGDSNKFEGSEKHEIQRNEVLKEWGETFGNINDKESDVHN